MNQREYESALKDLLEGIADRLEYYEPHALERLWMPQNVPGVPPINLAQWLDARMLKRGFTGGKWDEKSLGL